MNDPIVFVVNNLFFIANAIYIYNMYSINKELGT